MHNRGIKLRVPEISELKLIYDAGNSGDWKVIISPPKWTPETLADLWIEETGIVIGAFRRKKLLGFAAAILEGRTAEIIILSVFTPLMGSGLTELLAAAAVKEAGKAGVHTLFFFADSEDSHEQAALEKIGFTIRKTRTEMCLKI